MDIVTRCLTPLTWAWVCVAMLCLMTRTMAFLPSILGLLRDCPGLFLGSPATGLVALSHCSSGCLPCTPLTVHWAWVYVTMLYLMTRTMALLPSILGLSRDCPGLFLGSPATGPIALSRCSSRCLPRTPLTVHWTFGQQQNRCVNLYRWKILLEKQ